MTTSTLRPLAVVTGASSGIGLELARRCVEAGFDLLIASDEAHLEQAADALRSGGSLVDVVQADLATIDGVDRVIDRVGARRVDALLANAGHGLGHAFLDQEFDDIRHVIDTNVTGTLYLIHSIGRRMRRDGVGRILITGSIAGYVPGPFQAVYSGSKAFIDSFAIALRNELGDSGVTVTCLMPGATDTNFFARADMLDTKVGQSDKDDPATVAADGFEAMMRGAASVVSGVKNKLQAAVSGVTPATVLAAQHRTLTEPIDDAPSDELSRSPGTPDSTPSGT